MDSQQTGNVNPSTGNTSGKNSYTAGVPGDTEESLMIHLFELRNRLAIVLIWLFLGIIIAFPYSAKGMLLVWKEFISPDLVMTSYSPLEWTFARLKLCLVFALAISIPQLFYQLYRFAGKGLYPHEKRFFIKVIPASFLLFIFGTAIGYPLCRDYNSGRFRHCIPASPSRGFCSKNGACTVPDPQKTKDTCLQRDYGVFPLPFP